MVVGLGFKVFERQILQLALYGIEAELVGNLRIEVEALPALGAALSLREDVE